MEFSVTDAVSIVTSPFTGQTQAQQWPGADAWSGTMTFPELTQDQADEYISFLMQCRGMAIPFLLGDPTKRKPRGLVSGVPTVDGSVTMSAGGQVLSTAGWTPNKFRLLLPGDYMQVGYRLHRCIDVVNSDASGKAAINIWPSLREVPIGSEAIILNNAQGLFRLASNKRTWSADATFLSRLSFPVMEYR